MSPRPSKPAKRASEPAKHAGGRPPKKAAERLSTQLGVRLNPDDAKRLDRIWRKAAKADPESKLSHARVARRAMALGLELLEREPSRLYGEDFDAP